MIWRGFCGFVLGLVAFGLVTSVGTAVGIPEGEHWFAVGIPLVGFMTYAGAITK